MERANFKDRKKDVYDRLVSEWFEWNATMLLEIDESFTFNLPAPSSRIISARRQQAPKPITRSRPRGLSKRF